MKTRVPHTFALLFAIILIAGIFTWIIPAGEFERETKLIGENERTLIVNGSYKTVEQNPQGFEILSAFYHGFVHKADIIVFIFIVGGAFMVINRTNSIAIGIRRTLDSITKMNSNFIVRFIGAEELIMIIVMFIFSLFGAIFGMSEETIPFVMILVPLAISMGYDSITGVSLCFVAAGLGFAGAILNPFTIGVAHGIAELQPFSGIEYRLFCFFVIDLVGITYVIRYAKKVKRDPESSLVYESDDYWRNHESMDIEIKTLPSDKNTYFVFILIASTMIYYSIKYPTNIIMFGDTAFELAYVPILTGFFIFLSYFSIGHGKQYFILNILLFAIIYIIVGVMSFGWYIEEISMIFLALGLLVGVSIGYNSHTISETFLDGMKDIAGAAIVVAIAGGIVEVLQQGRIIDTILFTVSEGLKGFNDVVSINLMFTFQTILNIFVPSGSGQAALTMPIMAPLSDLIGISRQASVMAYQFGDGFTNLITPTSGVLIGCLSMAKIPYEKWFKWMFKFQIILFIVAILLLIPTVLLRLNGF